MQPCALHIAVHWHHQSSISIYLCFSTLKAEIKGDCELHCEDCKDEQRDQPDIGAQPVPAPAPSHSRPRVDRDRAQVSPMPASHYCTGDGGAPVFGKRTRG